MTLLDFFDACLSAGYTTAGDSADYAAVRRTEDGIPTLDLYFEHSNGFEDWKNNLNFPARADCGEGVRFSCHRGFLQVFRSLLPTLTPLILDADIGRIYLVGYSHGAALATFAYEYARLLRPELLHGVRGIGFGSPRVLYGRPTPYLRALFSDFHPIRNQNDAVTHLPPRALGYRHVNRVTVIGTGKPLSAIDAHRPEHYRAALAQNKTLDLFQNL
ncbi:MAG: hypothetical protein IJW71_01470 [Clostridia bacterium]|nr:hypothetical protein [Clostridia bacterium]